MNGSERKEWTFSWGCRDLHCLEYFVGWMCGPSCPLHLHLSSSADLEGTVIIIFIFIIFIIIIHPTCVNENIVMMARIVWNELKGNKMQACSKISQYHEIKFIRLDIGVNLAKEECIKRHIFWPHHRKVHSSTHLLKGRNPFIHLPSLFSTWAAPLIPPFQNTSTHHEQCSIYSSSPQKNSIWLLLLCSFLFLFSSSLPSQLHITQHSRRW